MKAYIASPFFTSDQSAVVDRVENMLTAMGVDYFSPRRGTASKMYNTVTKDFDVNLVKNTVFAENIININNADVIYANPAGIDSGTYFEIGYGIAKDIPVIFVGDSESTYRAKCNIVRFTSRVNEYDRDYFYSHYIIVDGHNIEIRMMPAQEWRKETETYIIAETEEYYGFSKLLVGYLYGLGHKNIVYVDIPRKSNLMLTCSAQVYEVATKEELQMDINRIMKAMKPVYGRHDA